MKRLISYVRCVVHNRLTLAGYSLVGARVVSLVVDESDHILSEPGYSMVLCGIGLNMITECGLGTLRAYERLLKRIDEHRTIEPWMIKSQLYCDRVGYRMAAKEAGLETLLETHLSQKNSQ